MAELNVVIPLGRLSKELRAQGFSKPLQFTSLLGRPLLFWLIDNLSLIEGDTVYMAVPASDEAVFQLFSSTCTEYARCSPKMRLVLVPLFFETKGVCETLYVVTKYMSESDAQRITVVLNGDMIFKFDILGLVRGSLKHGSVCFLSAFHDGFSQFSDVKWLFAKCAGSSSLQFSTNQGDTTVNSYEVRVISSMQASRSDEDLVCIGAYAFASGADLATLCKSTMEFSVVSWAEKDYSFRGLVYSSLRNDLNAMLGVEIMQYPGREVFPLKTREMIDAFIRSSIEKPELHPSRVTRYVFEMYGGILDADGKPRPHIVSATQTLKGLGHCIIISSSRGRSASAVLSFVSLLEKLKIPFNELNFSDPHEEQTVFIGSTFLDARGDLFGSLGIPSKESWTDQQIQARHFNNVVIKEKAVMKSSTFDILRGEVAYYKNIPPELAHVFPRLLSSYREGDKLFLVITRVYGTSCSHLITNRCMDPERLDTLVTRLYEIHSFRWFSELDVDANVYSNYAEKMKRRYLQFPCIYNRLPSTNQLYNKIITHLEDYENQKRAKPCKYVHGDPVLSNCMFSAEEAVFFDMNGALGKQITTAGDCTYDLAKVLQSLYGYDYIILDVHPSTEDENLLLGLRKHFLRFISHKYPSILLKDVQIICASLLFSLIPLHDREEHHPKFYDLCNRVMNDMTYTELVD